MKKAKINFDKTITAILVIFVVISVVFLGAVAVNKHVFDPAYTAQNNSIAAKPTAAPEDTKQNELIDKLKKEGFGEKEIGEAMSLAQYIQNKLENITQEDGTVLPGVPTPGAFDSVDGGNDKEEEDLSTYKKIAGSFVTDTAVELMLKMKKDFGSIGNVVDEYLFCLQAGINLSDYIGKPDEYKKLKKDKSAQLNESEIVTTRKIDEKLLEKLQKQNKNNTEDMQPGGKGTVNQPKAGNGVKLPEVPNHQDPLAKVPVPGAPIQPGTDNIGNLPDVPRPGADIPNVPRPADPGQNDGVTLPKAKLP